MPGDGETSLRNNKEKNDAKYGFPVVFLVIREKEYSKQCRPCIVLAIHMQVYSKCLLEVTKMSVDQESHRQEDKQKDRQSHICIHV